MSTTPAFVITLILLTSALALNNRPVEALSIMHKAEELLPSEATVRIVEHRITPFELEELKREVGVWEGNRNYNQIIDGHGTGLQPPTEEEWVEIASKAYICEKILLDDPKKQSLSSVDHTTKPWFPPIGNQGQEGSCTAWAISYYIKTFQEAKEHGWDLSGARWEGELLWGLLDPGHPSEEYQDRIFSPDFIYHLINHGEDEGSGSWNAINLISSIGACSWKKMPYSDKDHTSWPSAEAWKEAPLYRGNTSGYEYMWIGTDSDITSLKNWIASDHLAKISVDANKYSALTGNDVWTLDNYVNPTENHANAIVGYDDNIAYTEEGELRYGAFKIANSWGIGHWLNILSWENVYDGCYWISYEAMKQRVCNCVFYRDMIGYEPELVASFRISHSKRAECDITIGLGDESFPNETKTFNDYVDGGDHPFCANDIFLDITEFKDQMQVENKSFFLEVYDGDSYTTGTIWKFAVEHVQSHDTPLYTVNFDRVYADVTLIPFGTCASTAYLECAYDKSQSGDSWSKMSDLSSWSDIVMKASVSSPNDDWLYGPYITRGWDQTSMLGKPYTATFRLKISSNLSTSDVSYIDVSYDCGTVLKSMIIQASDFALSNAWQDFRLTFFAPRTLTHGLEFRVMNLNNGITDIYVDQILVEKAWNASTVYFEGAYNKFQSGNSWSKVNDFSSLSGIVLKASVESQNDDCLYGPYITKAWDQTSLLSKPYTVTFRLKISANLSTINVAYIDVCYNHGTVIQSMMIKASDFASSNAWQDFQLSFIVPSSLVYGLEFRVINTNKGITELFFDYIFVSR